ncbi:MAG: hypothetical protein ONB45_09305 [candidate division KSB1 bacterium]|nr:hypothetical protein [candidate division KSB1 bacterium]
MTCVALLVSLGWSRTEAYGQTGASISPDTKSSYSKSNQGKVFFHDGKWWALAHYEPEKRWYIWKYSGGSWSRITTLNKSTTLKYDATLDAATGKLYIVGSHTTSPEFWRFTYSSSTETWVKDTGFYVNPGFVNTDGANPVSLVQAKNGDLWIFRIESNALQAKRSSDGGATWSAVINLKAGLTSASGTTDAVRFTANGHDYVGVAYGEVDALGSRYGFLIHRDGDPDVTWTDESASLTFFGSERANNKIAAATDKNNNVYLFTQNANVSGSDPNNTLYKRSNAGVWTKFALHPGTSGTWWKTPAVVADTSYNVLYVMGVNRTTLFAEYKACAIGAEENLSNTTSTELLSSPGAAFDDLSVAAPFVGMASGLMICGDNTAASDIWFNQIALTAINGGQVPVTVTGVTVSPIEANMKATYTIALNLGNEGALAAGAGTITIRFPKNTLVVNGMVANQVTVNGVAATNVISNNTTREVTVTTPIDLANNANVTLVFNLGAQLVNPSHAGNYSLRVWTNAQTTPANSPEYAISAATTTVLPATVTPVPNLTNLPAAYTIAFNLGTRGRLISGVSTITVTFNGTTSVTDGNPSGVLVNGVNAATTCNSINKTVTITAPGSLGFGNNAAITITLPPSVITNPATAGYYTLTVATSVENTPVASSPYFIESTGSVGVGTIALSTNEANGTSSYTVPLTLGNLGALSADSGTITVQFPDNTFVPGDIAANQITVNGVVPPSTGVIANSSTRLVTITTPIDLANNASVSVMFNTGANLLNPSNAGSYALQAWTSSQPSSASSPAYSISPATTSVSAANVIPSPNTIGSAAAYTIAFNLGTHGRLIPGNSTITVTLNIATGVNDGNLDGVQINGVSAAATGNSANKTVVITAPASLSLDNHAAVTITLPSSAITNPSSAGSYTLTVATSVEATATVSNAYVIEAPPSPPQPPATGEEHPISGTTGGYDKPHQNRPFYHGGYWWTAARKSSDGKWYIWKLDGSSWSAQVVLNTKSSDRLDCQLDSPANKLYVMVASSSSEGSKVFRLSYSSGSWSIDSGFPVTLSGFYFGGERGCVVTKARNGELWAFRYESGKVEGKRSSDGGLTWSSTFTVKSGLVSSGLFDAIAFTSGGQNYVGVGYAENTASNALFGFLRHKDGDADNSWTDETSSIPQFSGAYGDDHMSLAVSQNNEIFFVCKTHPNSGSAAGIGLLKRSTSGSWQNFTIQQGGGWTRPAVVVDETNNELYVFGTQESSSEYGQYRKCKIGNESALKDAEVVDIFTSDGFNNISVPAHRVTAATDLLVCVETSSSSAVWYNLLPIGESGSASTPLVVSAVTVNPAIAGQVAAYTIPLTLGSNGALTGGSGTITITWPSSTTVPATIANSAVTVNGSTAANVTTTPASRKAVVTVPNNLANNASVSLVFANSAGIINPSIAGNYTLQVHTSAQPTDVSSPNYSISAAPVITVVTLGNITVTPDTVSRVASYAIPITLGSNGALTGGSGTITVTWPNNTTIPATIANSAVTVNGSTAANVTTTPSSRRAVVTVPNALANNANVTLIFASSAGITNPATTGSYTLQVQTSAQALDATSPQYNIKGSSPEPPSGTAGTLAHANMGATLAKSNQSKLFYHQSAWWLVAYDKTQGDWFLWKFQNGTWTRDYNVNSSTSIRIDVVLDSTNNKLYHVSSSSSSSKFGRLAYSNGTWTKDMSSVSLSDFGHSSGSNAVSLARAKNGELWLFRINGSALEAKLSTNQGASWSSTIVLKSGITGSDGATDGVTFTANGVNRVGVFYGMTSANGGINYGFLHHRDGDPAGAWTDESAGLTFFGAEKANDWVSAQAGNDGTIFVLTRNSNAVASGEVRNTLYKRSPNGDWSKFKVNTSAEWSSPVVAIDASNQRVYVMGVRTDAPNFAEYKFCNFGNESTLETQTATPLFKNGNDNFGDLTAPGKAVYSTSGLLACAGNQTTDNAWYHQINLGLPKVADADKNAAPLNSHNGIMRVSAYPNPFNPATTIRFTLHESAPVRLQIFNIRGELVKTLIDRELDAGIHESCWNGRDNFGRFVASGTYFYRLHLGAEVLQGKLKMVK